MSRGAEVCLPSWLDAPSGKGDSSSKESCQGPGLARCCCRLRRPDCIANACASDPQRAGSPAAVRGSRESGPQVATMCATEGPGIAGLQGSKVVDQDLQGIATERVRTTSSLRHDSDRFGSDSFVILRIADSRGLHQSRDVSCPKALDATAGPSSRKWPSQGDGRALM